MTTNSDQPYGSEPRQCAKCGKLLRISDVSAIPMDRLHIVCDECVEKKAGLDQVAQALARLDYWRAICPPEYQRTVFSHKDMPPPAKRDAVLNWPYGARGILLHGPTRRCKTRLMWFLLRRLIEEGHPTQAVTANEFEMTCSDAASHGRMYDWFTSLTRPDILFIDDLGKEKLTDRVEASLFAVIEHRTSHDRPILLTINAKDRSEMKKKFSPDRGAPIVERLCEFCTPIAL